MTEKPNPTPQDIDIDLVIEALKNWARLSEASFDAFGRNEQHWDNGTFAVPSSPEEKKSFKNGLKLKDLAAVERDKALSAIRKMSDPEDMRKFYQAFVQTNQEVGVKNPEEHAISYIRDHAGNLDTGPAALKRWSKALGIPIKFSAEDTRLINKGRKAMKKIMGSLSEPEGE